MFEIIAGILASAVIGLGYTGFVVRCYRTYLTLTVVTVLFLVVLMLDVIFDIGVL